MARSFTAASSHYLENANGVVTALPLTFSCWFYQLTDQDGALITLCSNGATNHMLSLIASGVSTNDILLLVQAGGTLRLIGTSAYSLNTWTHAGAVLRSLTDYSVYVGGGNRVNGTTSPGGTPTINTTSIGRRSLSTPDAYFNGHLAEIGVWNVALSDNEIAALGAGAHPTTVRPANLVGYWELGGNDSPEPDWHTGNGSRFPMTVTSATKSARHPPVVPYVAQWWGSNVATAAADTFTGSGALAAEIATLAGTGTHTAPTYTGTGTLTAEVPTLAGTGTFTAPVYSAAGDLAAQIATLSATGTHTAPVYSGTGTLQADTATLAGSGTHTAPVYSATGALAGQAATLLGSGTHTAPVYTGSGSLTAEAPVLVGVGLHADFVGVGTLVAQAATLSGVGTHTATVHGGLTGTIESDPVLLGYLESAPALTGYLEIAAALRGYLENG